MLRYFDWKMTITGTTSNSNHKTLNRQDLHYPRTYNYPHTYTRMRAHMSPQTHPRTYTCTYKLCVNSVLNIIRILCVCVCACVRACMRACMHACMHACVYALRIVSTSKIFCFTNTLILSSCTERVQTDGMSKLSTIYLGQEMLISCWFQATDRNKIYFRWVFTHF